MERRGGRGGGATPTLRAQEVDFSRVWATLKQDLFLILEDPFHGPTDNWEYLHRLAYNICIGRCYHLPEGLEARFVSRPGMPQPAALYRVFEESLERYLQEHTMQKWRQLSAELHCGLTAYVELWDRYNVGLDIVHRIFHYLNREYVAREHGGTRRLGGFSATKDSRPLCGIHTLGIIHWRDLICIPLAKELMDNFMVYTERLRRGDNVERSILRRLTESFCASCCILSPSISMPIPHAHDVAVLGCPFSRLSWLELGVVLPCMYLFRHACVCGNRYNRMLYFMPFFQVCVCVCVCV